MSIKNLAELASIIAFLGGVIVVLFTIVPTPKWQNIGGDQRVLRIASCGSPPHEQEYVCNRWNKFRRVILRKQIGSEILHMLPKQEGDNTFIPTGTNVGFHIVVNEEQNILTAKSGDGCGLDRDSNEQVRVWICE